MWKNVPGYPNIQAHADGRIRRTKVTRRQKGRGGTYRNITYPTRELKPSLSGKYYRVTVPNPEPSGRYQKTESVHVLVALAHCKKKPGQYLVRHKDGDTSNNTAHNLLWGTYRDNEKDKRLHGRTLSGGKHPMAKLTETDAQYIRENYVPKSRTNGAMALGRMFGVHRTTIENIAAGRTFT